jgi:hypothetical protein
MSAKRALKDTGVNLEIDENSFSQVSFKTYNKEGREIILTSDKVSEDKKDNFSFKNVSMIFFVSDDKKGGISADKAKAIRADKAICEFTGNVKVAIEDGILIKTEKSLVDFNQKTAMGDVNIKITYGEAEILAQSYLFDMGKNLLILTNSAKGFLKNDKVTSNKMVIHLDKDRDKSIKSLEAIDNASYVSINYNLRARHITYAVDSIEASGHVVLLCKNDGRSYDIRSDHMHAMLDKSGEICDVVATGSLLIKTKDATVRANKGIFRDNKITVYGDVVISGDHGDIFGTTAVLSMSTGEVGVDNSSGIVNGRKRN